MYRLAAKLPIMLCPSWTKTLSQPVFIDDVVRGIQYCLTVNESLGLSYDLACPEPITYMEMLTQIGKKIGREPKIFPLDVFTPRLSSYWLSFISGAPLELTRPLVASLKEPMLIRDDHVLPLKAPFVSFSEALERTINSPDLAEFRPPHAFKSWFHKQKQKHVRSIQRLNLPSGWNAEDVAREYAHWLPGLLKHLVKAELQGITISCHVPWLQIDLLRLRYSDTRSSESRCLLYIVGGILVGKKSKRGRLEFRTLPHKNEILIAIHDYIPSLPWPVYRFTQAIVHNWVMSCFARHLRQQGQKTP